MIIGIDASRAFVRDKTGTETYSYHLIKSMLRLPKSRQHTFVLFIRPNAVLPKYLDVYTNVIVKEVKWKYLWTQVGLAWETWKAQTHPVCGSPSHRVCRGLDVLWVPAHTLPVLRRPGLKTVVTIHGLEYQWLREYKNWLQRWYLPLSTFYAAKSADKLIAVSKFSAKQLEKELHTIANKIKVIYEGTESHSRRIHTPGVKGAHTPGVLGKHGLQDKNYVLFVGSIQPRKNLVALIEAFSHTDLDKLVIAGGVGWMTEDIFKAPSKFGVQEKVVFTGRVSDLELRALYSGTMMYVQPSITEGFGLPVLEAMAAGVPVITSDGGALGEVVGEAGVVVELGSHFVGELARAMERVASEPELRKKLISMGYRRVKEFSWDKAAKATLDVIVGEGYNLRSRKFQIPNSKFQI